MRIIVDSSSRKGLQRFALRPAMFSSSDDSVVIAIGNMIINTWKNYYSNYSEEEVVDKKEITEAEKKMIIKHMDSESARVICEVKWKKQKIDISIWIKGTGIAKGKKGSVSVRTSNAALEMCNWLEAASKAVVETMDERVKSSFAINNFIFEDKRNASI